MTGYISLEEAVNWLNNDHSWRRFQVDYLEATSGSFSIEIYDIPKDDLYRLRTIRDEGMARDPGYGTFRKLIETVPEDKQDDNCRNGRKLWMSDTRAEILEHKPILDKLDRLQYFPNKRVLINGLGLGVIVHAALLYDSVDYVDIVEINWDIINLIGPFLADDPRVNIHHGDAFDMKWPSGRRWDIVWHDIWPTISEYNLPEMDRLVRKYKNKAGWQGCWQRKGCLAMAKTMRMIKEGTLPMERALEILGGKADWMP
jgi:hypothetical protein